MEAVMFIGIQGSGKSTFFKERFYDTHIRINLDMLRTKFREQTILDACLKAKQKFVIDKTNLTSIERQKYIDQARKHGFRIIGYYFQTDVRKALERNGVRNGKARIPDKGLFGAAKRLQIPTYGEKFDDLFYVRIDENNEFIVERWKDEV
jgi:predicted kinase